MKALLIIDLQQDFLQGGALSVPHGDEIIEVINELQKEFALIVASKDWHPSEHVSFAKQGQKMGETIQTPHGVQELWPIHCVQHTKGAEFPVALHTSKIGKIFFKGSDPQVDSYSAFFDNARLHDTGLARFLRERGVDELFVVGLATDFCVKYSVLDALDLGFRVNVIERGCRGIQNTKQALEVMRAAGAVIL